MKFALLETEPSLSNAALVSVLALFATQSKEGLAQNKVGLPI
jgi:hypothetical protein